jgi:hypothetical protein
MNSTCSTCRHWLPRETPAWAARMHMAVCARKQTKAVTMSAWRSCNLHQQADQKVLDARVVWLESDCAKGGDVAVSKTLNGCIYERNDGLSGV